MNQATDMFFFKLHLMYKLSDALRVYWYFLKYEQETNYSKVLVKNCYIICMVFSAGISIYIIDYYLRKQ